MKYPSKVTLFSALSNAYDLLLAMGAPEQTLTEIKTALSGVEWEVDAAACLAEFSRVQPGIVASQAAFTAGFNAALEAVDYQMGGAWEVEVGSKQAEDYRRSVGL